MAKKLEHKKIELEVSKDECNCVVELMRLLQEIKTDTDEAKLNETSMKDALGRKILF